MAEGDFLEAGDFEALAIFDDVNELGGVQEAVVGAGVEPGGAAAEQLYAEVAAFEIEAVEVGDFQFAAGAGFEGPGQGDDILVVEIQAGDGVVGFGLKGFFLERKDAAVGREFDHAVGFGVGDVVAEDGRAGRLGVGGFERGHEVVAVEEVVAEDQGAGFATGEESDVGGDGEGLGQTIGRRLLGIAKRHAELAAIAKQAFEEGQIAGRGDDQNLTDAGQHQNRQRIVDHRLVVNRHELLGDRDGERVEAGAGAAGEDDAFSVHGKFGC